EERRAAAEGGRGGRPATKARGASLPARARQQLRRGGRREQPGHVAQRPRAAAHELRRGPAGPQARDRYTGRRYGVRPVTQAPPPAPAPPASLALRALSGVERLARRAGSWL